MSTRIRTALLMAGLTGLLVVIGAAIGGGALFLFAAFAVALNLAGYWFSDRLALKASRAQPVEPGTMPWLEATVQELAARAQLPVPRLYLIPSDQPNAFATGRNPEHAAVAVTEGLLRAMPEEQVRGVLAHELGHIKNHDILVGSIAAMVAGRDRGDRAHAPVLPLFGGDDEDSPLGFIGTIATIIFAPLAAMLLQLAVSRQREYLADATGAKLLGRARPRRRPRDARAGAQAIPMNVNPATASLYMVNPLPRTGAATLFMTHPPLAERIRRLRELDAPPALALAA